MTAFMRSAGLAAVLVLSTAVGSVSAQAESFKPLQGVSLHMGAKHAVGYYVADSGVCQLTLVVGDEIKEDALPATGSARFRAAVGAGKTARIDTGNGTELEFRCAPGATAMTVETLKQVAYTAPRK